MASMHQHHGEQEAQTYATMLTRMNRFQEPEARTAISDLQLPRGSRGLDVGCGVGLYTLWLAEAIGPQGCVVGIDHVAERVAAAQQLVGGALAPGRLSFRQGDGTALAEADDSLDWVWCGDVLHHMDDPVKALTEFMRVVRPGGHIIIKESQVFHALFLPGHLALERQLQWAELQYQQSEAGVQSFQVRRQRTRVSMFEAGLRDVRVRTYLIERQAPMDESARTYIQHVIFDRNWGPRIRGFLDTQDWAQRSALCDADSPQAILARPDYYCIYPVSIFTARLPM
jgi:demethylmenaquinone methyltransferase/2-methoxy-6-polyprenyl-1,4-benzoquinol methylase